MTTTILRKDLENIKPDSISAFIKNIDTVLEISNKSNSESIFTGHKILFQNIMISVLIKGIYYRKEISEFEKGVFKQFLKDETEFKLKIEDVSNTFYNDFVIDNLKTKPTTRFDSFIEETHLEFEKFMKSKSLSELRKFLRFLT